MINVRRLVVSILAALVSAAGFVCAQDVKPPEARSSIHAPAVIQELELQPQSLFAFSLGADLVSARSVDAPDLSRYREFQFGMDLAAVATVTRAGFERMVAEVCLGKVGAVAAREVSRFARNSRDWQQLVEVCRVVDTVLIDQEMVYSPRKSNDRLLLGLKGSLNEYELDLLRQRSLEARREKARRGELLVAAPVGYLKAEDGTWRKIPIFGFRRRSA